MVGLMAAITIMLIMATAAEQAWVDVLRRGSDEIQHLRDRFARKAVRHLEASQPFLVHRGEDLAIGHDRSSATNAVRDSENEHSACPRRVTRR